MYGFCIGGSISLTVSLKILKLIRLLSLVDQFKLLGALAGCSLGLLLRGVAGGVG